MQALIVDDNDDLRKSLAEVVEGRSAISQVFQSDCGEAALDFLQTNPVGLVLLDILMPGMGGVACCREIKSRWPGTKVLILTSNQEEEAVIGCVVAGADGYVVKKSGPKELMRGIERILAGDQFLDPEVTGLLLKQFRPKAPDIASEDQLSDKENQILQRIAQGMTNKEIGESLGLTEKTARNYVARILEKLGFSRRSQAAAYVSRMSHGPL